MVQCNQLTGSYLFRNLVCAATSLLLSLMSVQQQHQLWFPGGGGGRSGVVFLWCVACLQLLLLVHANTFRGNSHHAPCVFPFTYKGRQFDRCLTVDFDEEIYSFGIDFPQPWCRYVANLAASGVSDSLCSLLRCMFMIYVFVCVFVCACVSIYPALPRTLTWIKNGDSVHSKHPCSLKLAVGVFSRLYLRKRSTTSACQIHLWLGARFVVLITKVSRELTIASYLLCLLLLLHLLPLLQRSHQ